MTTGEKQEMFARSHQKLLEYAHSLSYGVRQRELQRTPEMAALYVKRGTGVANSTHIDSLAIDMYLTVGGTLQWSGECYDKLGVFWKGLSEDAGHEHAWGGDFGSPYDPYHFSIEHKGVR